MSGQAKGTNSMKNLQIPLILAFLAGPAGSAVAAVPESTDVAEGREAPARDRSVWGRDTLTDNWFGAGDALAEHGLTLSLSATQVYQGVVHGGVFTHRHAGRYAGSYDLEVEGDAARLLGLKGGSFYILAEGSWSEGLDASSVGSVFGTSDDAGGDRTIDVTEFWYEQALLDDRVRVRIGKIDLTGGFEHKGCPVAFDCNAFAGDETTQFLNSALVNNPTIPFPDNGIGMAVYVVPADGWYVAAGIADAQADAREMGFNTAFDRRDDFFSIFETGLVLDLPSANGPLAGACRLGMWYDPQPKARWDGSGNKRDDTGFYLSLDQVLLRERADPDDTQGLGVFARFGCADEKVNPVRTFWSAGCQYQGLIPGRDDDVLAVAVARGRLTDEPGAGFTAKYETIMEAYYGIQVAPWLVVSPHIQYVADPGGIDGVPNAVIMGVRVQAAF